MEDRDGSIGRDGGGESNRISNDGCSAEDVGGSGSYWSESLKHGDEVRLTMWDKLNEMVV